MRGWMLRRLNLKIANRSGYYADADKVYVVRSGEVAKYWLDYLHYIVRFEKL